MRTVTLIALTVSSAFAYAQQSTQRDETEVENIVVTSSPLGRSVLESATPISVLSGDELQQNMAATLGDTLNNTVGVHSSYFGPVAGSPIIRGLDGPRIKVVRNGLDVSDASRVGPDHAVTGDASTATQIEILRGPATLLYGSGAIGGVVNVVDSRLPQQRQTGVSGSVTTRYASVADEINLATNLDGGQGEFAWHLDGFYRQSDDYRIPGFASSAPDEDEQPGRLENTAIDTNGFTLGAGWIGEQITASLAVGQMNNRYGVPGHHGHHDEEQATELPEEESTQSDQQQDNLQLLLDWRNPGSAFKAIHMRGAYTDYAHSEIEDGQIGTTFINKTQEGRLWAELHDIAGWRSVIGTQYKHTDFSAIGDEAFTPPTVTIEQGIYLLEENQQGNMLWQLGGRIDRIKHTVDAANFAAFPVAPDDSTFTTYSASLGGVYRLNPVSTLHINLAHSERAPDASELYAFGPHIGAGTYEIGSSFTLGEQDDIVVISTTNQFKKEKSLNLDLGYRVSGDHWHLNTSVFYNNIANYIFQQDTGLVFADDEIHHEHDAPTDEHAHEELPVFQFAQQDATLYGFEVEWDYHINDQWRTQWFSDYTRARLADDANVPRIPPLRLGAELHFEQGNWHGEISLVRNFSQNKIAASETSTAGYTLLDISANYYMPLQSVDLTWYVKGSNLLDEEARVHASFLKDNAPLPGRGLSVGVKASF